MDLDLDTHIEILLPGTLLVGIFLLLSPDIDNACMSSEPLATLIKNELVVGLFLFALAYVAGVLCHVVARFPMDLLAEWTFCPVLLRAIKTAGDTDAGRLWPFSKPGRNAMRAINAQYMTTMAAASNPTPRMCAERFCGVAVTGALFVRLWIPAVIAAVAWTPFVGIWSKVGAAAFVVIAFVFTLAYSELMIYKEAAFARSP